MDLGVNQLNNANYGKSYTMILHYSIGSLLNKKASLDLNLYGEKNTEMTKI